MADGQAADHRHRHVLDRSGRRLGGRRGDVDGSMAGQDRPGHAGALGRPQDGAEVAGIGDPVQRHEERGRAAPRGDEVVEVDLGQRRGQGQHALGRLAAGLRGEPPACSPIATVTRSAAASSRMSSRIGDVVALVDHPHLADRRRPAMQQLADGLAPLDLVAAEAACCRRRHAPAPARGIEPARGRPGG